MGTINIREYLLRLRDRAPEVKPVPKTFWEERHAPEPEKPFTKLKNEHPTPPVNVVGWEEAVHVTNLPHIADMIQNFADDPCADNATCLVREIMSVTIKKEY